MALNVKQEAFCLHYAKTGNATEAYKKAGYSAKSEKAVYANANRLIKNDSVKARLQELADEMKSDKIAGIREIQERLTSIFRGEVMEEQIVVEGCGDGYSEARVVERMPQLKDIIKAGETLGRMQGAFDSKMTVKVTPITFVEDLKE